MSGSRSVFSKIIYSSFSLQWFPKKIPPSPRLPYNLWAPSSSLFFFSNTRMRVKTPQTERGIAYTSVDRIYYGKQRFCRRRVGHISLLWEYISSIPAKYPVAGTFYPTSIPDAPSPVCWHVNFPTFLNLLRGVPQIEINQHATYRHVYPTLRSHGHSTSHLFVLVSKSEDLISDSFDCDDARSPDAHFLLGPVLEVMS